MKEIKHFSYLLIKELKILNRIIRFTKDGIELEADLRHAELIVSQLGLKESKELTCPSAEEVKREDDEIELNNEYTTQYKSIVARANYLATDRPDIQYAVKKLATSMSKPTNRNWQELKRLGRYLKGKPRLIIQYTWQNPIKKLASGKKPHSKAHVVIGKNTYKKKSSTSPPKRKSRISLKTSQI